MKTLIFVLLTVVSVNSYCQKTESTILTNQRVLGKNLVGGTDITGTEFIFPDRIQETYLDTTSGFLTAQLRGTSKNGKWLNSKGDILVYDLNTNGLKWSKKINCQTSTARTPAWSSLRNNSNSAGMASRTALERASVEGDIRDFVKFLGGLVESGLK